MATALEGIERVLVVDECPEFRSLLADTFRFWGAQPTEAATASEAVMALATGQQQLVLLSWDLPGQAAARILSYLRGPAGCRPGVVVFTTQRPGLGSIRITLFGNELPVISKPFQLSQMKAVCMAAIRPGQNPRYVGLPYSLLLDALLPQVA